MVVFRLFTSSASISDFHQKPFLILEFTPKSMVVRCKGNDEQELSVVSPISSHTVFELEVLTVAIRTMALKRYPESFKIRSRDMLVGPYIYQRPAIWAHIGHPGLGLGYGGMTVHCSGRSLPKGGRWLVDLEVTCSGRAVRGTIETDTALNFADQIYDHAKLLDRELL